MTNKNTKDDDLKVAGSHNTDQDSSQNRIFRVNDQVFAESIHSVKEAIIYPIPQHNLRYTHSHFTSRNIDFEIDLFIQK